MNVASLAAWGRRFAIASAVLAVASVVLAVVAVALAQTAPASPCPARWTAVVVRVVDGDTISGGT